MWKTISGIGLIHNHAELRNFFDFNLPNRERGDIKEGGGIGGVEEKLNHNERVRNEVNQKAKDWRHVYWHLWQYINP